MELGTDDFLDQRFSVFFNHLLQENLVLLSISGQ